MYRQRKGYFITRTGKTGNSAEQPHLRIDCDFVEKEYRISMAVRPTTEDQRLLTNNYLSLLFRSPFSFMEGKAVLRPLYIADELETYSERTDDGYEVILISLENVHGDIRIVLNEYMRDVCKFPEMFSEEVMPS